VSLSGPEIQANLRAFVGRWNDYAGTEKSEAQTFLNELFTCYGTDRREVGARFEDFAAMAGFMDLHWPGVCIIEMKRPGVVLDTVRGQVERYRLESSDPANDIPAARYVVICSFQKFEIWQPGEFPKAPRAVLDLVDLPDRYDVLNFLVGPNVEPSFVAHDRELTKEAAGFVAQVYESLVDRVAAPAQDIQRFIMQSVWCMFAEDLRMLSDWPFDRIVRRLLKETEPNSAKELGFLFRVLNQKGAQNRTGELAGTAYVNGDLFAEPAEVMLNRSELTLLAKATEFDWGQVDPTIFGSLMEGVLGDRRWELGAHYTHEVDIMKIVGPTIVRPWQARIDAAETPQQARDLLDELCAFRVLDPACGCGNFLYVAYRELRALESQLKQRIRDLARDTGLSEPPGPWPYVPLTNMQGIELEPTSALIARVTLWMGHRQMIELYGEAEKPLPLVTLSSIQTADALRVPWPETDCIVGNPPFLGDRHLRSSLGDAYVDWLSASFGIGVKDLCVYWFRLAVEHLKPGQRAGLVGTNSISQNRARSASLDYVTATGHITDAVSSQKWPGDAKVHVSLVNWVKGQAEIDTVVLDGVDVEVIGPDLRDRRTVVQKLSPNNSRAFYGPVPIGKGFVVDGDRAGELLVESPAAGEVVRPYITGADIADSVDQSPSRWTIDFGTLALEQAMKFATPLAIVREKVRPERERNRRASYRNRWWQFGEPCIEMRSTISGLQRFVLGLSTGKRPLFVWGEAGWSMNNSTVVFAFDDDFSMGVLQSRAHVAWAWHQSSTLKGDLRYTPSSVFMTFPWPDRATPEQRARVAQACRDLLEHRGALCVEHQVGLTALYNAMDDGAHEHLRSLHRELDEAVAACYGWEKAVAQDDAEIVRRLTELNHRISEGELTYHPFD
jgi:hypothetical protein